MEKAPIGIFDSGVGGLTVLKALSRTLKEENFIYFGDTARVPYGTKSQKAIIKYSFENAKLLLRFGIKLLVVACNTSSAYALDILKEELDITVVGVIKPGAVAAVESSKSKRIGVIGTPATIKSEAYKREILLLDPFAKVFGKACPLLVPLIEEGWIDDEITESVVRRYLQEIIEKRIDTIVLGCTHYPLIKETIKRVCGDINLVDSAEETAKTVKKVIKHEEGEGGKIRILVSDKTERFEEIAQRIFGGKIEVEEVTID